MTTKKLTRKDFENRLKQLEELTGSEFQIHMGYLHRRKIDGMKRVPCYSLMVKGKEPGAKISTTTQ
jgi:RNase P subunit RPR2